MVEAYVGREGFRCESEFNCGLIARVADKIFR